MSTKQTQSFKEEISIPDGINANVSGHAIVIKGKAGEIRKTLHHPKVHVKMENGKFIVSSITDSRQEKSIVGTYASHLRNMFEGATHGYTYRGKIVSTHFPMTVKVVGKYLQVENYLGERTIRKSEIIGDTKVDVKGEDVVVTGPNLEDVSQTIANMENATKISGKDRRKFKDGIYITVKAEKGINK
jgi:large subunit ribosomal protein L6